MRPLLLLSIVASALLMGCGKGEEVSSSESMSGASQGMIKDTPPKSKGSMPKAGNSSDTTTPP